MNHLIRWAKFNLIGVAGMGVQLGALAVLTRLEPTHYLCATATALEITLLHNFAWHVQFTWRDRRGKSALTAKLLRFQLSSGLVSLLGNLLLMRVLVQDARLPILPANTIAILCCSILNFYIGDRWAFAQRKKRSFME
jgi:putative flippase GtrA